MTVSLTFSRNKSSNKNLRSKPTLRSYVNVLIIKETREKKTMHTYNGTLIQRWFKTIGNYLTAQLALTKHLPFINVSVNFRLFSNPCYETRRHIILFKRIPIPFACISYQCKYNQCKLTDIRCNVTLKYKLSTYYIRLTG